MQILCPHCKKPITLTPSEVASLLRQIPSTARTEASRENGRKGGRPKGSKNRPKTPQP